ncbi:hypothetical protein V8C44DRAFT_341884 [Trichoderma aethiopicum]
MGHIRDVMSLVESSYSALDTLVLVVVATFCHCPTVTSIRALYALQEFITTWKWIDSSTGGRGLRDSADGVKRSGQYPAASRPLAEPQEVESNAAAGDF